MAAAGIPTSIRLTPAEKRRIAVAARRRGLTPAKFIKLAALERTQTTTDDERLVKLANLVGQLREAVEDEIDSRVGDAAWDRHVASGEPTRRGDDVWRELGI